MKFFNREAAAADVIKKKKVRFVNFTEATTEATEGKYSRAHSLNQI